MKKCQNNSHVPLSKTRIFYLLCNVIVTVIMSGYSAKCAQRKKKRKHRVRFKKQEREKKKTQHKLLYRR